MNSDDIANKTTMGGFSAQTPSSGGSQDQPLQLIEVSGFIKWFDAAKGYGFIMPDNGKPDVLLHVTVLRTAASWRRQRGRASSSKR